MGVHGWLLAGRLWHPLRQELAPRWSLWCPDLPGFGGTVRPRGLQASLASYGRWLAEAAQQEAAGRPVVLVGHSLGEAWRCTRRPCWGAAAGPGADRRGGGVYQPRPFARVRRGGAAFLRWRPVWAAQLPGTDAIRSPLVAEGRAARGLLACSTNRGAVRQLPRLAAKLQVPSLWIAGSRDQVMQPRYVRHLAGYSPDHQLAILNGLGHLPMGEQPRQLAALIGTWLEQDLELPTQTQGPQSVASPFSCNSASWA